MQVHNYALGCLGSNALDFLEQAVVAGTDDFDQFGR